MMDSRATSRRLRTVLVRVGAIMARRPATAIRFGLRRNTSTRPGHFRLFLPLISVAGIRGHCWPIGGRASLRLCLRAYRVRGNVWESRSLERLFFLLVAGSMAAVRRDSSDARLHAQFSGVTAYCSKAAVLRASGEPRPPHTKLGGDLGTDR